MWQESINHLSTEINFPELSDRDIVVYPNPSSGLIWIKFMHIIDHATLEVYDIFGRRVQNQEILNKSELPLRLPALLHNTYFLRIVAKDLTWNKKILVIH